MQTVFLKISNLVDYEKIKNNLIEHIKKSLAKKGEEIIKNNIKSIEIIDENIYQIKINDDWKNLNIDKQKLDDEYINNYVRPILNLHGDEVPVSKVNLYGENIVGTSKHEKRNVASNLPKWDFEKCIQCGKCTFVCPHSALRAKLLNKDTINKLNGKVDTKTSILNKDYDFHLEVSPKDCLSCGLCESICPTKAITLNPKDEIFEKLKTVIKVVEKYCQCPH